MKMKILNMVLFLQIKKVKKSYIRYERRILKEYKSIFQLSKIEEDDDEEMPIYDKEISILK